MGCNFIHELDPSCDRASGDRVQCLFLGGRQRRGGAVGVKKTRRKWVCKENVTRKGPKKVDAGEKLINVNQ